MAEEQDKLYNVSATAGGYYTKGMGGTSFVPRQTTREKQKRQWLSARFVQPVFVVHSKRCWLVVTGSLPYVQPYGINTGVMLFDGNKYRTSTFLKDVCNSCIRAQNCVKSVMESHLFCFSHGPAQIDNAIESYGIEEFRDRHARLPVRRFNKVQFP